MKKFGQSWLFRRNCDDPPSLPEMGSSSNQGLWIWETGILTQIQEHCGHQLVCTTVCIADWRVLRPLFCFEESISLRYSGSFRLMAPLSPVSHFLRYFPLRFMALPGPLFPCLSFVLLCLPRFFPLWVLLAVDMFVLKGLGLPVKIFFKKLNEYF